MLLVGEGEEANGGNLLRSYVTVRRSLGLRCCPVVVCDDYDDEDNVWHGGDGRVVGGCPNSYVASKPSLKFITKLLLWVGWCGCKLGVWFL